MKISGCLAIMGMVSGLALTGCSEVGGTITDADTGQPIEDVRIGLIVLRPFTLLPAFPELTQSDSGGRYNFTHRESNPWMYVRSPGYFPQVQSLPNSPSINRNIQLHALGSPGGDDDFSINFAGTFLGTIEFIFSDRSVQWISEFGFTGTFDFEFNGKSTGMEDLPIPDPLPTP